jgi:lysylphosphatidylglycerol synthetase-like protein (DUF2156 family)
MKTVLGAEARAMGRKQKWDLLSPHLRRHGREALAYATLQEGMEYFVDDLGYIAFSSVTHPVFARHTRQITLSDPVCALEDQPKLVELFLSRFPHCAFGVISEHCAGVLRGFGFKANGIGFEPEIPVQTYNTKGNWKELDMIKRARNEARREGIVIREATPEDLDKDKLAAVSATWMKHKKLNDREIWLYARRPVFEFEEDVRKFVAYDRDGKIAGFVFYDPMYRDGQVVGYSANISRCDEQRFGRLATAVNMEAVDKFRAEGREVMNLLLAPFVGLESAKYNDDLFSKLFFQASARFGNNIYNFKGLSFHKSKYRAPQKCLYFASNRWVPSNDIYLAFLSAEIAENYFSTVFKLVSGAFQEAVKWRPSLKRTVVSRVQA